MARSVEVTLTINPEQVEQVLVQWIRERGVVLVQLPPPMLEFLEQRSAHMGCTAGQYLHDIVALMMLNGNGEYITHHSVDAIVGESTPVGVDADTGDVVFAESLTFDAPVDPFAEFVQGGGHLYDNGINQTINVIPAANAVAAGVHIDLTCDWAPDTNGGYVCPHGYHITQNAFEYLRAK